MEVRESRPTETFGHVDHPLLHRRVRDPRSDREGELMAVVEEFVGTVAGTPKHTRTAYVRAANGLEFTAAPDTLVAVSRICAVCDRPILTGGRELIRHSASGARPSDWVHDLRDPSCKPVRAGAR